MGYEDIFYEEVYHMTNDPRKMTALERLCKAEGVQGGVIHSYNRMFGEDVTYYEREDFFDLAARMALQRNADLARLALAAAEAE